MSLIAQVINNFIVGNPQYSKTMSIQIVANCLKARIQLKMKRNSKWTVYIFNELLEKQENFKINFHQISTKSFIKDSLSHTKFTFNRVAHCGLI